ncbi:GGDEF domain-containing protein [Vibrio sp.]|uniref:GGDEF domain-containing protein n=1 Tax=Vibrio sp. TaxID=678 RepID=UPI003D0FC672
MKILIKNYLLYTPFLVVLAVVFISQYLVEQQLIDYNRNVHQQLQLTVLDNISDHLTLHGDGFNPDLKQQVDLLSSITGYRVSLISPDGTVVADSTVVQSRTDQMDNQADRPEVIRAMQQKHSVVWRFSETSQSDLLYTAQQVEVGGQLFILRLARPQAEITSSISEQQSIFYGVGAVALALISVAGVVSTRYVKHVVDAEHLQLEGRIKERTREISELNNISTLLNSCNNYDELEMVLRSCCLKLFPEVGGSLAIYHASRDKLRNQISWGSASVLSQTIFKPSTCWSLKKGGVHFDDLNSGHIACIHTDGMELPPNKMCIPLTARGDILGVLQLFSSKTDYLRSHESTIMTLAENLSLALASLNLRDELRNQALHDPLTGLFNRRYLKETLEAELNRSQRHHKPLAVVMFDVDHFKRFNDLHGHHAGDRILQELGHQIEATIRKEDIACRYGGEEFVLLLSDSDQLFAVDVAERLRCAVGEMSVNFKGEFLPVVTLSAGIAVYPQDGQNVEILLEKADYAMYDAKHAGRNCVRVCGAQHHKSDGSKV